MRKYFLAEISCVAFKTCYISSKSILDADFRFQRLFPIFSARKHGGSVASFSHKLMCYSLIKVKKGCDYHEINAFATVQIHVLWVVSN